MARRGPGRPRNRGVKKQSTGARAGGARRTNVYRSLKEQGFTEVSAEGITVSLAEQPRFRPTRRQLKKRGKRAIKTERPVSPRHEADLIKPEKPFTVGRIPGTMLSTAIKYFDYDYNTRTLLIEYWGYKQKKASGTYVYMAVPVAEYEGLLKASSKGRYVYYRIRTRYQYKRIK